MLREPLFHFLAAGALIFLLYGWFGGDTNTATSVTVTAEQVDRLKQVFAGQWRRPPTESELRGLVDAHIEEEILYREAVALGLDADDTIVRRRLAQKMQFLIEDIAAPSAPTDAELTAYFEANRASFRLPPTLSFTHVYFSADRREDAAGDAATQLASLGDIDRAPDRGDAFMLRHDYADISAAELGRLFGREFAAAVFALPTGTWQGPVKSGYGFHLVRIVGKTVPAEPEFAEARARVATEYLEAERRRLNREALDAIKARYTVTVAPALAPQP